MMTATVEEKLAITEMARQLRTKAATEKANRCHYSATLLTRAADLLERQALSAAADGPAVPEGREPASVADEVSDAWRWWAYHPEECLELFTSDVEAKAQAVQWLNEDRKHASEGWHEEQHKVAWGYLVPVENAQITERRAATEDDLQWTNLSADEVDEVVTYEMRPSLNSAAIVAARARAALAEPEPEGPTFEQLYDLASEHEGEPVASMRAALARWGNPAPTPPADGEVAELVEWLRKEAEESWQFYCHESSFIKLTRAAELLQRQAMVPVSVSERLPGPGDCDAEGRCWIYLPDIGTDPSWRLADPRDIGPYHTHWLPAHALLTPTIESD